MIRPSAAPKPDRKTATTTACDGVVRWPRPSLRPPDRAMTLMVGAGWHIHLDILVAHSLGTTPEPFWDGWSRLKTDYDLRLPA